MKKNVLKILIGSIMLEAILVSIQILTGDYINTVMWQVILSLLIISEYSIPCLLYAKIHDDGEYESITVYGTILACILAFVQILTIWQILPILNNDILNKINITLNIIVWVQAVIPWMLSYRIEKNIVDILKKITIALIILVSLWTIEIIWTEKLPEEFMLKLFIILIVLNSASLISTVILILTNKNEIVPEITSQNITPIQETKQEIVKVVEQQQVVKGVESKPQEQPQNTIKQESTATEAIDFTDYMQESTKNIQSSSTNDNENNNNAI